LVDPRTIVAAAGTDLRRRLSPECDPESPASHWRLSKAPADGFKDVMLEWSVGAGSPNSLLRRSSKLGQQVRNPVFRMTRGPRSIIPSSRHLKGGGLDQAIGPEICRKRFALSPGTPLSSKMKSDHLGKWRIWKDRRSFL